MVSKRTVLIIGANGQVGQELLRRADRTCFELLTPDRSTLDICQQDQVVDYFASHRFDAVINAAAYTAVDQAETERSQAFAANAEGAKHLAVACATHDIPLLHLSTDYVFDGNKATAYTEQDVTTPTSVYGESKRDGELQIAKHLPRHLILRVSWVFGRYGNNFVHTMLRLARQHPGLRVVSDQFGGPTWAGDIADTLWLLTVEALHRADMPWGIYHYSGYPTVSWHAFAEEIFRQAVNMGKLEHPPTVTPIGTVDYPTPASRPTNSTLDCSLIQRTFGIEQHDWREGLSEVLKEL